MLTEIDVLHIIQGYLKYFHNIVDIRSTPQSTKVARNWKRTSFFPK